MQKNAKDIEESRKKALEVLAEGEKKRAELRFKKGMSEIEDGNFSILKNIEFQDQLKSHLLKEYISPEDEELSNIIKKCFKKLSEKNNDRFIVLFLEKLSTEALELCKVGLMSLLCNEFFKVYGRRERYDFATRKIGRFLAHSALFFARSNLWTIFNKNLLLLWTNRNKSYITQDGSEYPFRDLIPLVSKKDVFEKLFHHYLECDDEQRKKVSRNIRFLGDQAIEFLLHRLVYSNDKEERYGLITIISSLGENIVSSVKIFLEKDLPWYAVRNIVFLVTEIGYQEYYPMIEGYLVHPDKRVQRQVVAAIIKLGGKNTTKRLVEAMAVVDEEIKEKIIMQIGSYDDETTGLALIDLIKELDVSGSEQKDDLIKKAIISLRSYPYKSVIVELEALGQQDSDLARIHGENIHETINIIGPKLRHKIKEQKRVTDQFVFDFDPEKEEDAIKQVKSFLDDLAPQFEGSEKENATEVVFSEIVKFAKQKQFHVAELLRDRLLEINPDALQDVIKVSEVIEEQKSNPITSDEGNYWEDILAKLLKEDINQLVPCFSFETYHQDERIIQAGEVDPCLYFVNSGSLKLSYTFNKREIFLKKLRPGDIIGVNPFFSSSVWTVNLTALEKSELQILKRDVFVKNVSEFERVEEILEPSCREILEVDKLIKMSGSERREAVRYRVNVTINNILLDYYGRSGGKRVFQGEMLDISSGGLAFIIKLQKRENADQLLGRQIISEINLNGRELLKCFGKIVSVNYHHEIIKEYSVHVQFYEELEQSKITEVLNLIID